MKNSNGYAYQKAMQRKMAEEIHVSDLVEVIDFYPEDMTVDVKPLVMAVKEESFVSRPPILKVPVATISGGKIFLRPWYEPGDVGIIVYMDYDSDNAFVSGEETEPLTTGCHSGKDGVFIGGALCGENLPAGFPEETITIGTEETYISFGKDVIKIHGKMEMEGELMVNGKAVMLAE